MSKIKELTKNLTYKTKLFWDEAKTSEKENVTNFANGYKTFLNNAKTERETVDITIPILKKAEFSTILENNSDKKVFAINNGKSMAIAIIGKKPVSEGINVIAAHIDSPRVDLKQNPLYQDSTTNLGIMRTHYYGGIKKYQWLSTPLALHGIVIKNDGTKVNISIGEDCNDPVFVMPDLLPHLAGKQQYSKKIGEAVSAENMNLIFSSIPYFDQDEEEESKKMKDAVKINALVLLNEKYGITEKDFISAELQLVPAGKARDCGLDKSLVLGYGQDDRICAYTSLQAILNIDETKLERTAVVLFTDKEEVGSDGNTGAKSIFLQDFLGDLLKHNNEKYDSYTLRKAMINSQILSADVNAAINPNYPAVHEASNAVKIGYGVSLTKFTGSGGKGGSNDANSEFMTKVIDIFDKNNVNWQIGTLGKVDEGGGGTIAKFLAEKGAQVIDCGTGLLGMHSLYELCSKADLYSTYKAYLNFLQFA